MNTIKRKFIFWCIVFVFLGAQVVFAKEMYLVRKDGKRVNIENILPKHIAGYPVALEIYIPNFWGGKYRKFNEKYGEKYGRKVLGGYDYSSASILAIVYGGIKVVDTKGRNVEFLDKIDRKKLMYAVAKPSKVNDLLYNVIRNYIIDDTKEGPENSNYNGNGCAK